MADVHSSISEDARWYNPDDEELPSDPAVGPPIDVEEVMDAQAPTSSGEWGDMPPAAATPGPFRAPNVAVQTMGTRDGNVVLAAEDRPNASLPFGMTNREWRSLSPEEQRQARNDPEGMEVPRARAAADMQQRQQAYLQQMQSMPLTNSEQIHLRRMQQGLSMIRSRVATGDYSAEQGMDLEMQAMTGINPLLNRQRQAQIAQIQQHTALEAEREAQMHIRQQQADTMRARTAQDLVFPLNDPQTGQRLPGLFQRNPRTGAIEPVQGAGGGHQDRQEITPAIAIRVSNQVDQQMARETRDANAPTFEGARPPWMASEQAREQERERRIQRGMTDAQRGNQNPRGGTAPTGNTAGASWSGEGGQPGAGGEAGGQGSIAPRRIAPDANVADLPADQRTVMQGFQRFEQTINAVNSSVPDAEARTLTRDLRRARDLYEQYGHVQAMPPAERSEFTAIVQAVTTAANRPRNRPAPAAPRRWWHSLGQGAGAGNVAPF